MYVCFYIETMRSPKLHGVLNEQVWSTSKSKNLTAESVSP